MTQEAIDRKERSIKILKQHEVPFIEHLPLIETKETVRVRTKDEIAKRAIACLITIQLACDMSSGLADADIAESKEFFEKLLIQYGVKDCLTEKEKLFFTGHPEEQSVTNMTWKYEAYWVLLWALGLVKELSYPAEICDCDSAIKVISEKDSYESILEKVVLRDVSEILDETDLIFRYDWACVDARIKGLEAPKDLNSGVVMERHKACNWLIDADQSDDWDNVSANT